jgi:hypothetical protein
LRGGFNGRLFPTGALIEDGRILRQQFFYFGKVAVGGADKGINEVLGEFGGHGGSIRFQGRGVKRRFAKQHEAASATLGGLIQTKSDSSN